MPYAVRWLGYQQIRLLSCGIDCPLGTVVDRE